MQQIIVIHGGSTFNDHNAYLRSLTEKKLNIDRLLYQPKWKELLQKNLGDNCQVLLPTMPNSSDARYVEWKIWFENITNVITDDCILIGHSLGGIFLAKYLSENKFSPTIKATVLIAAPYSDESKEDLGDFRLSNISEQFSSQAGKVTLFFGNDDPVIATSEIEKYRNDLPNANFQIVSAPDHFVRSVFPELLSAIRSI